MPESAAIPSQHIYGERSISANLLSVGILVYRRLELLRYAIESSLGQTGCSPFELIVLDDDQSPAILEVVSAFSPSALTIYQNRANLGMWGNQNRALEVAHGEWILILHDDDLLLPDALSKFERIIRLQGCDSIGCLAGGTRSSFDAGRAPIVPRSLTRFPLPAKMPAGQNGITRVTDDAPFSDIPKHCSSFYRREYIRAIGGWDPESLGYADVDLFLRVQRDKRLYVCGEVFGIYQVHAESASHPSRWWQAYPPQAARRLLSRCAGPSTPLLDGIRSLVERECVSHLWKAALTPEQRRTYAAETLQMIQVRSAWRRALLKRPRLLRWLAQIYAAVRPLLGRFARLARKQSTTEAQRHRERKC